jgi:preprotein translocase subunit SecE
MFTQTWASIKEFISDVRGEIKKISFPTRTETVGSTTVVIVFCIIMALYLSGVDMVLAELMKRVLRLA